MRRATLPFQLPASASDSSVLKELLEISAALSQERNLDSLLALILEKSRLMTMADAGSIYIVERPPGDAPRLRFKQSQNESVSFDAAEFTVPISMQSIAGAVTLTEKAIRIEDVYKLPADAPYHFDSFFDKETGYRTRSILTVPMMSGSGKVIGVVQVINRRRKLQDRVSNESINSVVVPFDQRAEELLMAVASQAAIALENAQLYEEIRGIFDGFVRASVQAIEQRDPTTSGHSVRVSHLSLGLAKAVHETRRGKYADVAFTDQDLKELEYASLLHDFGKIGVREEVLVKAKKLYPMEHENLRLRFEYVLKSLEANYLSQIVDALRKGASEAELAAIGRASAKERESIEAAWKTIEAANEPTVLHEGDFSKIEEIGHLRFKNLEGQHLPLLRNNEIVSLQVRKGSLDDREITMIRSHVSHTIDFLSKIPWGTSFARIPTIAGAHHEKLNGKGYPKGLTDTEIPLLSKIMAIADIYDALTARDRPYKKAVPKDKALHILSLEAKDGHVDGELVKLFEDVTGS